MAGFGGGRGGGGRSGGFGGGRSGGFSRSRSSSHHSCGNRTTIFIGGGRHYGYGGRQMSGRAALITFGIFMLFFGFIMSAFTPKMEKVEAVITDVDRMNDAYGVYYEYEIEYEFNDKLITPAIKRKKRGSFVSPTARNMDALKLYTILKTIEEK